MDVSRVSMVTPKTIDWRKLTAKEIIKYDAEGMEIPSQYLSWARSFRVDLEKNDTDETTYEMAVSKPASLKNAASQNIERNKNGEAISAGQTDTENNTTEETQDVNNNNTQNTQEPENNKTDEIGTKENSEETDTTSQVQTAANTEENTDTSAAAEGEENTEETGEETNSLQKAVEDMTAQEKLQYLQQQGKGDYDILKTFTDDSNTKSSAAEGGIGTVTGVEDASGNAAESVESFMQQVMSEAQELQQKLQQGKKKDRQSNIAHLNEQLNQLGTSAQTTLAMYEGSYINYGTTISEQIPVGDTAVDFGDMTIDLGEDWIKTHVLFDRSPGRRAKKAGKSAVSNGEKLQNETTNAVSINDANKDAIPGHQNTVMDLTGVKAVSAQSLEEQNADADTAKSETEKQNSDANNEISTDKTANEMTQDPQKAKTEKEQKEPVIAKAEEELKKGDDTETDDKKTEVEKKEEKIASGSLDEILKRKLRRGLEV